MNREIKFKGIRKDNNEWITGYYYSIQNKEHYILNPCVFGVAHIEVLENSICQFTGLQDSKGNHIYEGDVLKTKSYYSYYVVFENGAFVLYHTKTKDIINKTNLKWGLLSRIFELGDEFSAEIIGNIIENPELINN